MNISDYALVTFLAGIAALFFYNIKTLLYPDKYLIPLGIVSLLYILLRLLETGELSILYASIGGLLALAVPLYILFTLTQGKYFGYGDVKLATIIGLLLGFNKSLITLAVLLTAGLLISVLLPKLPAPKRLSSMRISSAYLWAGAITISLISSFYLGI